MFWLFCPLFSRPGGTTVARQSTIDTATHVAGSPIKIAGRCIQRCLVCGEKLADTYNSDLLRFWAEGEMVREYNGFLRTTGKEFPLTTVEHLPRDFCLKLVEM